MEVPDTHPAEGRRGWMAGLLADLGSTARELIRYRELLLELTRRDLLLRYKQTVMGYGWAISMPVLNMVIFSVIFTRVVRIDTPVAYPVFAYAGLLPWNCFATSLRFCVDSLTRHTPLVTKVYFPREVLPFSAILVCLVDFGVASSVLAALMLFYGVGIHATVLLVPVIVGIQVTLTAALGLLLAMGNLFYRDVKYLFEVLLTAGMFATAVVYPIDRVGGTLGSLLALNPMTHVIDAYRALVLYGQVPPAGPLVATAAFSVALFVVAWVGFHRAQYAFAENV